MGKLILILGGARSGKSRYAEQRARESGGENVLYVATSEMKDEEMRRRVEKHRSMRPPGWTTLEAPLKILSALHEMKWTERVVLLDCVTFLVSNYLLQAAGPEDDPFNSPSADPFDAKIEAEVVAEVEGLISYMDEQDVEMLVVSNEVGLGIVPPYELGRAYRDVLGRVNQILARHADEVLYLVAGLPMRLK